MLNKSMFLRFYVEFRHTFLKTQNNAS